MHLSSKNILKFMVLGIIGCVLLGASCKIDTESIQADNEAQARTHELTTAPDDSALRHRICKALSENAESLMKARQHGADMAMAMEIDSDPVFHSMVIKAYEVPRFSTGHMQTKAVEEFKNDVYLNCIRRK